MGAIEHALDSLYLMPMPMFMPKVLLPRSEALPRSPGLLLVPYVRFPVSVVWRTASALHLVGSDHEGDSVPSLPTFDRVWPVLTYFKQESSPAEACWDVGDQSLWASWDCVGVPDT